MKKIKIITFQNAHNYGAILQTYALQKFLLDKNYDVEDINYQNSVVGDQYKIFKINKSNELSFAKSIVVGIRDLVPNIRRHNNFESFINKNIRLTREYRNENELKEKPPKADVYIVGSDQVWNTGITQGLTDAYTLNFGDKNINRISYAASIGNPIIYNYEKTFFKNKLKILDYISVRENLAKESLNGLGFKNAKICIDPTLLISAEVWNNLIADTKKLSKDYILAYDVEPNDEYYNIVNKFSESEHIKVVHFEKKNRKYKNVLKKAYTSGPLEFMSLIKNSRCVICTSFHATVFSIIFHKDFYVIPHKETGNRVTSLLDLLNIKDRVYYDLESFISRNNNSNINWNEVDKKLEKLRKESSDWLINAIEGENNVKRK